jgi:hypothetical protein
MKKIFLIPIILLAVGCRFQSTAPVKRQPVACTQEAKQCPDGSYVGRTGPNCEFAACPQGSSSVPSEPKVCPQIAKPCPDGSYVSPQGPNCEIPACPIANLSGSGISGKIVLGPTCPVERIPPDPACAPKGYQATVIVKSNDGQKEISRFTSQADGSFSVNLPPGTYLLVPISTAVYPRGLEQTVIVEKNKYTDVTISFDSGIR